MSKDTSIEWADSTLNLQMGCDGCELWNPKNGVKHCYAGELTNRYGGRKGYPRTFAEPALFLERLAPALKWSDLTGTDRPEKPWLNGLPRMIFLNDMGDTFTEALALDWLAPLLPQLADSPHVWMILTKRGGRMLEFSRAHPFPANVWPGVSVTSQKTVPRIESLLRIDSGGVKWISAEPLLGAVDLSGPLAAREGRGTETWPMIGHVIIGGESGPGARPCDLEWICSLMRDCNGAEVPIFVKQLGAYPVGLDRGPMNDPKRSDPADWPAELRVRQMPKVSVRA